MYRYTIYIYNYIHTHTLDCLIILSSGFLSQPAARTGTQEIFLCPGSGPEPGHRIFSCVPVRGPARDLATGRFVGAPLLAFVAALLAFRGPIIFLNGFPICSQLGSVLALSLVRVPTALAAALVARSCRLLPSLTPWSTSCTTTTAGVAPTASAGHSSSTCWCRTRRMSLVAVECSSLVGYICLSIVVVECLSLVCYVCLSLVAVECLFVCSLVFHLWSQDWVVADSRRAHDYNQLRPATKLAVLLHVVVHLVILFSIVASLLHIC
jgi:hypothetical protein